jgi:RNA polymerase sigma-70 factor (ECF subfamily)
MPIDKEIIETGRYHMGQSQLKAEEAEIISAQVNPKAFEPLYLRYFERICQYIYHRVEDKEVAFDLTSTVFYKALESLPKYKNKGFPFSSWLYRIAFNEIQQHYRRTKTQAVLSISSKGLNDLIENLPEYNYPITDVQLFEAIELLKEDEVELINMRYFENRSFKEIASFFEMGESACKMKLYRILEQIKQSFKDIDHE